MKLQDSTRYVHGSFTFHRIEKHLEDWEASNVEFFDVFEERITDKLREEFSSKLTQIKEKYRSCLQEWQDTAEANNNSSAEIAAKEGMQLTSFQTDVGPLKVSFTLENK